MMFALPAKCLFVTGRVYTILQAPASWEMDVNLATAATAVAAAFTCVYVFVCGKTRHAARMLY